MASGVHRDDGWLSDVHRANFEAPIAPDVRNWLKNLRYAVEEYEELVDNTSSCQQSQYSPSAGSYASLTTLDSASFDHFDLHKYFTPTEDSLSKDSGRNDQPNHRCLADDAFDNILKNLGNEIYQLDAYQRRNSQCKGGIPSEVGQTIMQIFNTCIEDYDDDDIVMETKSSKLPENRTLELKVPVIEKIPSFGNISILSDEVFLKSNGSSRDGSSANLNAHQTEQQTAKDMDSDINRIFYRGDGRPVPPKRKNRTSIEQCENIDSAVHKPRPVSRMEQLQTKLNVIKHQQQLGYGKIDSDSGNNSPASDNSDYQNIWHCSSGSRNSAIRHYKENYGLINTISFDSVKDIPNSTLNLNKQKIVVCVGKQSRPGGGGGSSTSSINSTHSESAVLDQNPARITSLTTTFSRRSCVEEANKRYSYDPRKTVVDRMVGLTETNVKCTSECDLTDECHRNIASQKSTPPKPMVRQRNKQENIYENIQVLRERMRRPLSDVNLEESIVDDDFNSSSVEIISDSDSWRTPVGPCRTHSTSTSTDYASESPIYENLEDLRLTRPLTGDVVAWKALLLDPYWNDDEEDEWISAEEAAVYARDQKPPYVIPRIKTCKQKPIPHTHRHSREGYHADEGPKSPTIKDVRRMFEEGTFNKATSESPKFIRGQTRIGGSTEALAKMAYSPQEPLPIEMRGNNTDNSSRYNKAKSLATPERKDQTRNYSVPRKVLPKAYDPSMCVILEGFVNRTKLTENGKKVKKNWHYNYAVLTQTSLAFYKDVKTYQTAKMAGTSITAPEAFVLLAGALVAEGTPQQTKRPNPLVITSTSHQQNMQQHILQLDDPDNIKHWFDNIRKAINKLPSDYVCPDNTNIGNTSLGTPSPTQKRASGAKSSSKVPEGSMEDLSDITEHVNVKSKLRKFFLRRPTMESLIKNGIYKDEPVFGRCLDQVCPDTNPQIPDFVTRCIKAIESSEENMKADGLYRASGNLSQVQKIRLEVDQNNLSILDKDIDVHVLTGALKLFFRELKEPVIPFRLFQKALNASSNPVLESRTKDFKEIVHSLPECNRQTLKYFLEHLLRVTARKEHNRMHISNLAIVLGPTLLWAPVEALHNMAIDCLQQNQVIEILLTDFDRIFKDEGKRK